MVARVTAVLGWCLCLGLVQVKGSYIPADMNRTIQNLLDHYVSTGPGPAAAFVAQFDRTPASVVLDFLGGCEGDAGHVTKDGSSLCSGFQSANDSMANPSSPKSCCPETCR